MKEEIRWIVTDPLGNDIILKEQTFIEHIQGDHQGKDSANRAAVEEQAKFTLTSPRFIIKNHQEGRRKYLDLVDMPEGKDFNIRTLTIIVDGDNEVVTWIPKRSINDSVKTEEGGMIYDKRMAVKTNI